MTALSCPESAVGMPPPAAQRSGGNSGVARKDYIRAGGNSWDTKAATLHRSEVAVFAFSNEIVRL